MYKIIKGEFREGRVEEELFFLFFLLFIFYLFVYLFIYLFIFFILYFLFCGYSRY